MKLFCFFDMINVNSANDNFGGDGVRFNTYSGWW